MNTMRRLAWVALLVVVVCSLFSMFHTDAQEPELDFEVFAPVVQKPYVGTPRPTPTTAPIATPPRPEPTPPVPPLGS